MEWYHVWWPTWLTSKRVARFVSDSWVFCIVARQRVMHAVGIVYHFCLCPMSALCRNEETCRHIFWHSGRGGCAVRHIKSAKFRSTNTPWIHTRRSLIGWTVLLTELGRSAVLVSGHSVIDGQQRASEIHSSRTVAGHRRSVAWWRS